MEHQSPGPLVDLVAGVLAPEGPGGSAPCARTGGSGAGEPIVDFQPLVARAHPGGRDRYRRALEAALARLAQARAQLLTAAFEVACARVWSEWDRARSPGLSIALAAGSLDGCGDPRAESLARIADAIDLELERVEDVLEDAI